MGREQRQQAELGSGQRRRSGEAWTALLHEPGPQRPGLAYQSAQAGPAPEQVIDLPHERPGTGQVGEREVDANELDPGLNGEVREGVGQQMPQPLSPDELVARRRDISPVHGGTRACTALTRGVA